MDSYSVSDTQKFAEELAKTVKPGAVICLDGDLGAGKTAFAQGFALGLGIKEAIVSPTFTIIRIYESGRIPLYHFDVYRIEDPDEMYELGFEDYFYGEGVTLIEWASQIEEMIPEGALRITIKKDRTKGDDYREITCS